MNKNFFSILALIIIMAAGVNASCGDHRCEKPENYENCPSDCTECGDAGYFCASQIKGCESNYRELQYGCSDHQICCEKASTCGNGVCDTQLIYPESTQTCPQDCPLPKVAVFCRNFDGDDYYTADEAVIYVNDARFPHSDECGTGNLEGYVIEYGCNADNTLSTVNFKCPGTCVDGACTDIPNPVNSCYEFDGDDYYTQNEAVAFVDNVRSVHQDTCGTGSLEGYVIEYGCNQDGTLSVSNFKCPEVCNSGACAAAKVCRDTDGGTNVFEAGTITYDGYSESDKCTTENTVLELYCSGDNYAGSVIECQNGCRDGACIGSLNSENGQQEQETISSCDGCIDGSNCIPVGAEIRKGEIDYVCRPSKVLTALKGVGVSCQNNDECSTDNCFNGFCAPECTGCLTEGRTCVPIGGRIMSSYCGTEGTINQQKTDKLSCESNYECTSNTCKEGRCKKEGLFRRIFGKKND